MQTNHTTNGITATVASVMTISALQAGGVPVLEILAMGAGCVVVAIAIKRQFKQPVSDDQPIDYSSISEFVHENMLSAMDRAGTTNPDQLLDIANRAYESLGLTYDLADDFALVAVIRWCIIRGCVPSPIPTAWETHRNMINQCFEHVTDVSCNVSDSAKDVLRSGGDVSEGVAVNVSNIIQLSDAAPMLAAMAALKSELGDKAKGAYSLYGEWCMSLSGDLLKVRNGREWLKNADSTLTVKQADTLLKVFKLKAVKDGLLVQNPEYKGKPPFPEYLITSQTTANAATAGE